MLEEYLIKKNIDRRSTLQIFCLGIFRIIRPGETEAVGIVSKHKMWLLFKYLIAQKGSAIRTEKIMDLLWPGCPYPTDTSILRTTLSRLRSVLEPKRTVYRRSSYIIYSQDSCAFNFHAPFWLDTDEFENLCATAHRLGESNRQMAIDLYLEALELYQGDFLIEDSDLDWAVIPREHYRRLFMDSAMEVASWLLEKQEYSKASVILKQSIKIDPYVEGLQILLMKALLGIGNLKAAAQHYSYCSSLLYKELGVKPSEEWKSLYKQIRESEDHETSKLILDDNLQPVLQDKGPFVCDADLFWNILLLEQRRLTRFGEDSSLVVLELSNVKKGKITGTAEEEIMKYLESVAFRKLRRCDVLCRLDGNHLALLLPFTGHKGSAIVVNQIQDIFKNQLKEAPSRLWVKVKRITPL